MLSFYCYLAGAAVTYVAATFVEPDEDLFDRFFLSALWPVALLLLIVNGLDELFCNLVYRLKRKK